MSKRVTQILSLILTLVMFLSVSTQAFAFGGIGLGDGWDREIGEDEIRDFDGPVEEEEEVDYFQTLNEDTGVQVTVEAPMGALPSLAELRAEPVEAEDIRDAVDSVVEGEPQILLALDISFWLYGQEIEPEEPVRVKITAPELEDKTGLTLVHIPDEAAPETVDFIGEEDMSFALGANEVAFVADSFSVYAITWDGEKTATIHWGYMDGDTFTPFEDVASLDSNAGSMSLDVIFDGYMYSSAVYVKDGVEYGLDSKILTKVTTEGETSWTMQAHPVGEGEETEPQTVAIENGADIYVYYVEKAEGYTPPSPAPADVKGPITEKNVTPNGDGTYKIRLDITGQQDHTVNRIGANVIVVMDITQSMTNTMSNGQTRMAAAKTALNTLINTLDPDTNLINFTAVNFGNSMNFSTPSQLNNPHWTSSKTTMQSYVTGLPNNPNDYGTCWQAGLYGGIVRATEAAADTDLSKNKTYIIFLTDGNPNGYYNRPAADGGPTTTGGYNQRSQYTQSGSGFLQAAYDAAIPNAVNASALCGNNLYGIFCGSSDDTINLQNLMNYNGTQGQVKGTFIDGTSADAIVSAFQGIAQTIVNDLGASEVVVDDGVPALTNVSAAVSGSAGGFKYYIKPKNGTETVWTDAPSAAYSSSNGVTWDLSKSGVLADGTVYSLEFTVWPSQAAYDLLANLSNGMPGWTLGELDDATLEQLVVTVGTEDYEYTPGETEGTGTWAVSGSTDEGMSTEDFLEFMKGKTVDYNVLTNTHLTTTYKYGNSTYTDPPKNGMNSGAMILDTTYFGVHKLWNNGIDFRNANALTKEVDGKRYIIDPEDEFILDNGNRIEYNSSNPDPRTWLYVDLIVTEDDEAYTQIRLYNKAYKGNDEWSWNKMYIAPGVLTHDSGNSGALTILEAGRDYSVKEKPDESYYWNLSAETYHPMVINGVAWVLQLVDEDDASAPDLAKNTFQGDYYNIEGEIFKKLGTADDALITAVNDRRSMLYVSKEVEGDGAPEDEVFTFSITLDSPNDPHPDDEDYDEYYNTFWFAIQEDPHDRDTIIMDDEDIMIDGATPEVKNGSPTGFYWFDNGGTVTVSVKAGQYITFSNLPLDTEYTISELGEDKMPEGFIFKDAQPGAEPNIVGFDPTAGKVDEDDPMKVAGTIDASNSDYFSTFTNKYLGYFYVYHSADNTVQRFPMAVNGVAYSADNPFDINALTKDGTLYGGYYQEYKGASSSFDVTALTFTENAAKDEGTDAKVYGYQEIKDGLTWDWDKAYAEDGTAMVPVSNTVYFLKEVPDGYLSPYTHYTYFVESKNIGTMWTITGTDDLLYKACGFLVKTDDLPAIMVESMTITPANYSQNTVTLEASKIFRTKGVLAGMLGYADITEYLGNETLIQMYWTTRDGVTVFGKTQRTLTYTGTKITDLKKTDAPYTPPENP